MKTAVCLIFCVLLLEQVHLLSASDDDEDELFASFFPESKGKPSKGTTAKGSAYVSTKSATRIIGPGQVSTASKQVVVGGVSKTTTSVTTHKTSTTYPPEEPEEEEPVKTKGKGKRWKKKKGPRSRKGAGDPPPSREKSAPTESESLFDFDALKDKFFGQDDDGDVVY